MDVETVLPTPCLVVLVGPSGAGKSSWAAANARPEQVVSSDQLRAAVGGSEHDLAASDDAFALLETIVERRLARRLTTVIDTLGLDAMRRRRWIKQANAAGVIPVAVVFDVPAAECRARNRRRGSAVPGRIVDQQRRAFVAQRTALDDEGFALVLRPTTVRTAPSHIAAARIAATAGADPATSRPAMRFGLQVPVVAAPGGPRAMGTHLAALARTAEEAGFDSIWFMDHLRQIPMFGPAWQDVLDCWTALTHVASATSTLRLGALVTPVTFRPVGVLAKVIASLDVLSGGRALCGLGLGWFAAEHHTLGLPFPSLDERYALLEDTIEALRLLWGPGTPAYEGRVLRMPEALCYPRPLQAHLPLLVGGGGERRTLAVAARHADAVNIVGEVDVVRRKVVVLREHCHRVGRDPASVEITQLSTTLVGRDATEVETLIERTRPRRTAADRWAERVNAGTVTDQVARFQELAGIGVTTAMVSLPDLSTPAPIERFAAVIGAFS